MVNVDCIYHLFRSKILAVDKILAKNCQSNKRHIRNNVQKPLMRTENLNLKKTAGESQIKPSLAHWVWILIYSCDFLKLKSVNLPGAIRFRFNSNVTNFFTGFRHLRIYWFVIEISWQYWPAISKVFNVFKNYLRFNRQLFISKSKINGKICSKIILWLFF